MSFVRCSEQHSRDSARPMQITHQDPTCRIFPIAFEGSSARLYVRRLIKTLVANKLASTRSEAVVVWRMRSPKSNASGFRPKPVQ
jgi:hypothetical protein